jgi:hypothetical protein
VEAGDVAITERVTITESIAERVSVSIALAERVTLAKSVTVE